MAYGLVKWRHLREEPRMLVAGRILGVVAGLWMFVMSVSLQGTFGRQGGTGLIAEHPLFILLAAFGLMIAFSSLVRKPLIVLAVLPAAAPFGLYCQVGEGSVKRMGYGMLAALLAGFLAYRGDKQR